MENWLICLLFSFSLILQLRLWLIRRCYEATDRMVSSYLCLVLNPCRQCLKALVLILSSNQHSNNNQSMFLRNVFIYLACFVPRSELNLFHSPILELSVRFPKVQFSVTYQKVFPLCFHAGKMFPFFFFQFFTSFYELVRRWALITTIYKERNPLGRTRCIHRHTCIIHDTPFRTLWI